MQGFRRIALALVLVAGLQAAAADVATAKQGRCPAGAPGTVCHLWDGRVTFIGDADTMSVDIWGDGTTKPVRVRLTGINAMEQTFYTNRPEERTGECHANEATARLEALVAAAKGRVRLAAQNPASRSGARMRRAVSVKIDSKRRDLSRTLAREGHALFLSNNAEWAWNRAISIYAQRAAAWRANLWNPEYCAAGPAANVRLWVNPEPEGPDEENEWVKVRNLDPVKPLPLGGWWVRDSALRRYTFPSTAVVPPGGTVTVWTGEGIGTASDFFWGYQKGVFDRYIKERGNGDGAYLFDPNGDLRASMQYPCRFMCDDPLKGAVRITVKYRGSEHITLRNRTSTAIDLDNYRLESKPHAYVFEGDSVLQPGEALRLVVRGDPDNDVHGRKYWGKPGPILGNKGDRIALMTLNYIRTGCKAWGHSAGSC